VFISSSPFKQTALATAGLIACFVLLGLMTDSEPILLNRFFIFILAIFIGYMVIWNVTPSLHTPLMSVTNAISGIIIVGSMLELDSVSFFDEMSICGVIGVFFASINVFGGFIVTQKMLNMFKSQGGAKSGGRH
jgi:NAD(P) transhydrogenase subunit alpha